MFMKSNIYNNMKRISLFFIISLFINDVFGDEVKLSVMEGENVPLYTHLTDMQKGYKILWRFNGVRIARINRAVNENPVYDSDERFTDRLKMNPQTGDLTITNITSEHTGEYQLDIINNKTITKTFSVSVFGDIVSVNDGGSVTLHTHLDIKRDDVIMWRFNGDRIAKINREINENPVYDSDKRFTDRLKMNPQTGDLTITHITSEHTGDYQLDIINGKTITPKNFSVSLSPQVKKVISNDSVYLHIDVTEKQRNDKIHWKIKHKKSLIAEIITQNGKISTPFIDERFRDRLKLNDQTGDLIITNMKNEDSGDYEADVTIGINTHTIHKTFSYTDSGLSSGEIAGISVGVLLGIAAVVVAAAAAVGFGVCRVIFRRRIKKPLQVSRSREKKVFLKNEDVSNGDVAPV